MAFSKNKWQMVDILSRNPQAIIVLCWSFVGKDINL